MHPLTRAFADRYLSLSSADLAGMERTAAALDARRAALHTASLEDTRALAREADTLAAQCGCQAGPWTREMQAACAARERAICGDECCCINPDTNTRYFPASGVGAKAGQRERPYFERVGARRHR